MTNKLRIEPAVSERKHSAKSLVAAIFTLATAAAICAFPIDSWANVQFCNRTDAATFVAVAYVERDAPGTTTNGHRGVTARGWWTLQPDECKVVSNINAGGHWVYYYAHSGPSAWRGDAMLCVPSTRFEFGSHFRQQGEGCAAGYRLEGFRRMNATTTNYTMNLNPSRTRDGSVRID